MNLHRKKACPLYSQRIQPVRYKLILLPFNLLFPLDMSSTSAWMESVIKKKQKKKGNPSSQAVPESLDMFEELNRYLKKPRLKREECPNPIAYWGVSRVHCIVLMNLICLASINLRILSSV